MEVDRRFRSTHSKPGMNRQHDRHRQDLSSSINSRSLCRLSVFSAL